MQLDILQIHKIPSTFVVGSNIGKPIIYQKENQQYIQQHILPT